ncbi:MAG: hypothetical protein HYY18_04545 [Planctomycetes bacterium]|nr:hypothetical protein [Planctomycetota bacterium]
MKTSVLAAAALSAALLAPGCGGGDGEKQPSDPVAGNGGGATSTPAADLEAECRAASLRWKTLRVVYKAEGGNPTTVTLAAEQGGRIVLRADPGPAIALDGAWCSFRVPGPGGKSLADRAPIGYLHAAARAVAAGSELPPRGESPALPPYRVTADLSLSLDPAGHAERHMSLQFNFEESPSFGWLAAVRVAEGVTVRGDEKIAVAQGPAGRIAVDRATGALLDWVLEPPDGRAARLHAESLEVDQPLDPALFRLDGDPAPRSLSRRNLLSWTLSLLNRSRPGSTEEETKRFELFVRAYYRAAWTDAELDVLAEAGAAKRREAARRLKEEHPEATAEDIAAASGRAALAPIEEALEKPFAADIDALFRMLPRIESAEARQQLMMIVGKAAWDEVVSPAFERSAGK